jgi:CRISPR/Cas system-associated exonuclease Cas4 (RecB family)
VWQDSLLSLRTDLREWLRQEADRDDGYVPDRFELSFGLKDRDRTYEDPASVDDAIALDVGLTLRGSIDLVELHAAGHVRVTDHKTGKLRAKEGFVVGGGEHLQPVLYALACERLLGRPVREGRLYYCTSDGGYAERSVPIDDAAASAAEAVAQTIGQAIDDGFLPAAPAPNACRFCDYTIVCGTLEEQRTQRKPSDRLDPLLRLRAMK